MRLRNINSLLAIVFAALMITSGAAFASTWSVIKNPAHAWPPTASWGTNIRANGDNYTGEAWFGEGTAQSLIGAPPDPPDGVIVEFLIGGGKINTWVSPPVNTDNSAQVRLRATSSTARPPTTTVTISSTMDDASANLYVPEDFSVTLENSSNSPQVINLRAASTVVSGLPLMYMLVLDNAVNITSVTTGDPLTGAFGDPLTLSVTVSNTGHLSDTYTVSANAGSVSTGAIAPAGSATVSVPATYPFGTQPITVEAAGTYATDEDFSMTLTGLPVTVSIVPSPDYGWTGDVLVETVTVTNLEPIPDTFNITLVPGAWGTAWVVPPANPVLIGSGASVVYNIVTPVLGPPGSFDVPSVTATSTTIPAITTTKPKTINSNLPSLTEFITPASQSAGAPGLYSFTVSITNTGALAENFSLAVTDDQGWSPSLNQAVVEIAAGATDTSTIITINMPNAPTGTIDTITMTENSVHVPSVGVDSIATMTKLSALVEVVVTILPDPLNPDNIAHVTGVPILIDPCWTYDPVTYAVKVANNGVLDDKYELAVTGPSTWGLKLTPDEFFVPAGDAEYASLSITLPDSWTGGVSGVVTVTAVGKLASENQELLLTTDNDSVTVTSGIENNVGKEVLPDDQEPQTGAPGSPLVWVVVLKNTGNVVENLTLSLSEELSGVSSVSQHSNWGAAFDTENFYNVAPCTKVMTYLRVTIPSDAKTSEWDTITVVADDGMGVTKIDLIRAHVVEPGPRIPEGQIEISVEAQVVSIEVWPNTWDFGILDEDKISMTIDNYFTVRNTGNVSENIYVRGTDAKSMPGEPVATWTLNPTSIGTDQYMLLLDSMPLTTSNQQIDGPLAEGTELHFKLTLQAPSAITTPARMYARIKLTAVSNLWP